MNKYMNMLILGLLGIIVIETTSSLFIFNSESPLSLKWYPLLMLFSSALALWLLFIKKSIDLSLIVLTIDFSVKLAMAAYIELFVSSQPNIHSIWLLLVQLALLIILFKTYLTSSSRLKN